MGTPNKDYREDPKRAVYIVGKISQELVNQLTPKINEFRLASCDPITAYIDSPGGSIFHAEVLRDLMRAPNPDGGRCRLLTVVTNTAASAAADFLALGDYSIGYDHALIVYHGSRQEAKSPLTSEMASSLSSSLKQTNEFFALRLARCAFARFVLRVSQFKDEFQSYINEPNLSTITTALRKQLAPSNSPLIREAMQKQRIIANLTVSVDKHFGRFKSGAGKHSDAKIETEIFKAILNFKTRLHQKEPWRLSRRGMAEVNDDFSLLHDFFRGPQRRDLARLDKTYGELFLTESQSDRTTVFEPGFVLVRGHLVCTRVLGLSIPCDQ